MRPSRPVTATRPHRFAQRLRRARGASAVGSSNEVHHRGNRGDRRQGRPKRIRQLTVPTKGGVGYPQEARSDPAVPPTDRASIRRAVYCCFRGAAKPSRSIASMNGVTKSSHRYLWLELS